VDVETVMLNLKSFAQDKANHYFYGSNIAAVSAALGMWAVVISMLWGLLPASTVLLLASGIFISAVITILVAAWKEWVHDKAHADTNTVDPADFWATVAGCVPVVIVLLAVLSVHAFVNR
jgi:hypothetical protein